jgi:hypothetical protein
MPHYEGGMLAVSQHNEMAHLIVVGVRSLIGWLTIEIGRIGDVS